MGDDVEIGLTLPTMVPGFDRAALLGWARAVEAGPYATLAVGERISYPNPEVLTTLAAAAAVTERVRIMATVVVLPMHPAVGVAKAAATIDVLSGGRFTLGVGIGGRDEDYRCLEAPSGRRQARMDDQVAVMRRVWAGEAPSDGVAPVGPPPVQPGGPPLYAGAIAPRGVARAARWADGITGFCLDPVGEDHAGTFRAVERAWGEAGRDTPPRHVTGFWYALGEGAEAQLGAYARRYLGIFGKEAAGAMASLCSAHGADRLVEALDRLEAAGCDEVVLVPTAAGADEVDRLTEVLARRP